MNILIDNMVQIEIQVFKERPLSIGRYLTFPKIRILINTLLKEKG